MRIAVGRAIEGDGSGRGNEDESQFRSGFSKGEFREQQLLRHLGEVVEATVREWNLCSALATSEKAFEVILEPVKLEAWKVRMKSVTASASARAPAS